MRTAALTAAAMVAFAANSLLCRSALEGGLIDAPSFASLRMVSGAMILLILLPGGIGALRMRATDRIAAAALIVYLLPFTFAYLTVGAGAGALLLFGVAQLTMFGAGWLAGERFTPVGALGCALAVAGFGYLLLPGLDSPPLGGALLMIVAGVAWGVYSLRGKHATEPLAATARNFAAAAPFAIVANAVAIREVHWSLAGVVLAITSGALASGLGYVLWYRALQRLPAITAATAQLSVPVIAALGGVAWLAEPLTPRLAAASCAILGGVALLIRYGRPASSVACSTRPSM